nr:poly(rc) binding protein [Hymenolepis microstoma]
MPFDIYQSRSNAPWCLPRQDVQTPFEEVTRSLLLPDELIGCIIGRGGAKINAIRQESKAFIKISDAEEGSNLRRITIKGSPGAVRLAIFYINHTVSLHQQIVQMNLVIDIAQQIQSMNRENRQ